MIKDQSALILIDLQNDFCSKGSLEVPDADAIIPLANRLSGCFDLVVATKDWHPKDHLCFASNHPGKKVNEIITIGDIKQILWPDHCIQETKGSEFHPDLNTAPINKIFYKGSNKNIDSYSAFFDNAHLSETGLASYLHEQGIKDVHMMGLATDYCVKYSCLDAVRLGFNTYVIKDACRGVNLKEEDSAKAFEEMSREGVKIVNISEY